MDAGSRPLPGWAFPATPAQPSGGKRTPDEACPSRGAVRARERLRGVGASLAGMAFRQALQLAACGLAGGSAAVLFSAVAVGKPRAGGDAEPRVVEPPAWAGAARPGPGVWDPNWDRCGVRGWSPGSPRRPPAGALLGPGGYIRPMGSVEGQAGRARPACVRVSLSVLAARLPVDVGRPRLFLSPSFLVRPARPHF